MNTDRFTDATLHEAETRFQHALLTNDVAALDQFLHDDVRFTGPDGSTIDKATDMAAHRSQAFALTVVDELDREVQVIDGVGITRTTLHLVGSEDLAVEVMVVESLEPMRQVFRVIRRQADPLLESRRGPGIA